VSCCIFYIIVGSKGVFGTTGGSIGTEREFLKAVVIDKINFEVGSDFNDSIGLIDFLVSVGFGGNVGSPLFSFLDFKSTPGKAVFFSEIESTAFDDSVFLGVGLEK
jgi:hypothetical protein